MHSKPKGEMIVTHKYVQGKLYDFEPAAAENCLSILQGLTAQPKMLPSRLLYDEEGSKLFDQICLLEEYYPTRTEISILQSCLKQVAALIGPQAMVVELGTGSGLKTRMLLENLERPCVYIPVEISRAQLLEAAGRLSSEFPELQVLPVCADYTREIPLLEPAAGRGFTLVFFPGSTIGNFLPEEAVAFLKKISSICGVEGAVLLGVDLKKDSRILQRAYNDRSGVTAAFNLNLLKRIAREFDVDDFSEGFYHEAVYNEQCGRIEMYLVSTRKQAVILDEVEIRFRKGEKICTEYSYKYSLAEFKELASRAGLKVTQVWTDALDQFSVQYLTPGPRAGDEQVFFQAAETFLPAAAERTFRQPGNQYFSESG
jgi:dimethylhistidine N-methyltransferase